MTARIDITGNKYGRLTVLGYSHTDKHGQARWLCRCECGTEKTYFGSSLKKKNTQSCGCLHKDIVSGMNNYQAKRAMAKSGIYFSSEDPYYIQAMCIMRKSRKLGIPIGFDSIIEFASYIKEITPDKCPVFNQELIRGTGQSHDFSPSVDKIIPEKGYVRGNIQVISYKANAMKRDASIKELIQFAYWILKTFIKEKLA